MTDAKSRAALPDIRNARELFPATDSLTYFNAATAGLASRLLAETMHRAVDDWAANGIDFIACEAAGERARASVAALIGTNAENIAQISSVSATAGFVAGQLPRAEAGSNVVVGEREFSSNHFPWRMLAERGYDVRQVPFRGGGVEPEEFAACIDGGTRIVAFSAVQTASGHRTDIASIATAAHDAGALVFVDGTQAVGALSIAAELAHIDVLAVPDYKYLLNAGRGAGYCYLAPHVQAQFRPVTPGWKAGRHPMQSFFGPDMDLSPTASRFDNSVGWLASLGDDAALRVFDDFGADAIYARNRELSELLREALKEVGSAPLALPEANRSTIVSVPLGERDAGALIANLRDEGIVCSARDGNLRVAVHFYNHEDDIARLVAALAQ